MTGTSMATPVVTGSIALLKGYYPWLKATNISYLLLETAYDKGVYSNQNIYGQGVLDLNAAITTPLGGLRLPEKANLSSLKLASKSKLALSSPCKLNS
jgi:subtilisin family serine protease